MGNMRAVDKIVNEVCSKKSTVHSLTAIEIYKLIQRLLWAYDSKEEEEDVLQKD